jgi:hypothetical protein
MFFSRKIVMVRTSAQSQEVSGQFSKKIKMNGTNFQSQEALGPTFKENLNG